MATFDKTGGAAASIPYLGISKFYTIENTVDISTVADTNVFQILTIKAKTLVFNVAVEIIVASDFGTSLVMEVGDGGDVDAWIDDVDCKGTAGTFTKGTLITDEDYTIAGGHIYTTADTIDGSFVAVGAVPTVGKIRMIAFCCDLN